MDHALAQQRPADCSKEPCMRPARPSSPRNQDVSYVLAEVFGDLYSQDVLHDDTILNLETSRTHDPDFHDYYVQLLNEIRLERKERLEALNQVEEHMLSAFSLAQEHNSTLQQDQNTLGIPERHVGISNFLDNDLLSKYNLLTPGSYLRPSPPSLQSPTIPDLPNFMKNTEVMEEHERARKVMINRDPAPTSPSKIKRSTLSAGSAGGVLVQAPAKNAWRDSMHPDVRKEEQKGLEKLQAKSKFLKTKRFVQEKDDQIFCTVPSKIHFDTYTTGGVYEEKLKIKNVSSTSRQLKALPPKTKYFTITKSGDPSQNGAIAPGLYVEYTVTFMPESLGSYEDELQIMPQGGDIISVDLLGERPRPVLSLPDTLDCGYCLVNGTLKTQFVCKNSGGKATFHIYPDPSKESETAGSTDGIRKLAQGEFLFDSDLPAPRPEFNDSEFKLTPTSFSLDTGEEVVLDVEFKPTEVCRRSTDLCLAVDNCTSKMYTVTAESQSCRVQLVAVSGGESTVDYDIRTAPEAAPVSINFEDQNPGTREEKMFIIRNCVNVPLHYNWEICKILTEEHDSALDVLLSADETSPFTILPVTGILEPSTEASFTIICNPTKAGKYENVSRLWVDDIPKILPSGVVLEPFDALHMKFTHLAQPHHIKLEPPAVVVPGEVVCGYTVSKTVKIINDSLSPANVKWTYPSGDLKFNIRPESFTVGAGSSRTVEIDIDSDSVGDKEAYLICTFENVEKPYKLFVKSKFRGPKVTIDATHDDPALDFGYIHYKPGCMIQREFDIFNNDGVTAKWALAEMDHCVNPQYGQSEFKFSESSGEIGPYEVKHVEVTFNPHYPRSLKSVIECKVENGTGSKIRVIGEIQEPKVVLKQSLIDLGIIYVGVPVSNVVVFESLNFADSGFDVALAEGKDQAFGLVEFENLEGIIHAGSTVRVPFSFTGREPAQIEDYTIPFNMAGGKVLALGIKADVKGLQVVHETPDVAQVAPETNAEQLEPPLLDFGTVDILTPSSRVLKIINKSHIPTKFILDIAHFKSESGEAPPMSARGISALSRSSFRPPSSLLSKSQLLLDPSSKSQKQKDAEYWRERLKHNKGACFVASPASGHLPGNGVAIVTVHCNTDMWGQYTDVLISRVGDMEPVEIPIKLSTTNSPLYYKLSNNSKPTVRFGCYPMNDGEVSRSVQISNQGPLDIRLDWETYNVVPNDDTVVDLNFFVGDAFPNKDKKGKKSEEIDGDMIRLGVTAHEGELSKGPFTFSPDQCVIPARGTSRVSLTFDPSYGVGKCDGDFKSFALAYQSLDTHVNTPHCSRLQGEDVAPLKIMMTGKVEVPEVIVTAEEHGFTFKLTAGIINSRVTEFTKIHKMSLLNSSKLHLGFHMTSFPPFTLLNSKPHYSLIPRQKMKLDHGFLLSETLLETLLHSSNQSFSLVPCGAGFREVGKGEKGEVEGGVDVNVEEQLLNKSHEASLQDGTIKTIVIQVPEKRYHLHSHLTLHYDNGHKQSVPVHCRIVLPTFYVTPQTVEFGTCLVGQKSKLTLRLINPTNSPLRWTAAYRGDCPDEGEFDMTPSQGEFTTSDSTILSVSFIAKSRKPCTGTYTFTGTPGNRSIDVTLRGIGSHDESMQRLL